MQPGQRRLVNSGLVIAEPSNQPRVSPARLCGWGEPTIVATRIGRANPKP